MKKFKAAKYTTLLGIFIVSVFCLASASFANVSSGWNHTLGIQSDGTLWAWGDNTYGELGDGTVVNKTSPTKISSSTWNTVATGFSSSFALKSDGTLWAWGFNGYGELGDNTTTNKYVPIQIGSTTWVSVSPGLAHTVGIRSDGALFAWGFNKYGQIGDNTTTNRYVPTQIGTSTWSSVSASYGNFTMGIQSDGTLWAWGYNGYGQLGDNTTFNQSMPEKIGTSTWSSVSAGLAHTVAIKSDGTMWAWGNNAHGELGDNTTVSKLSPTQIGTSTWSSVAAGNGFTVGIKSDGTLWAWGDNTYGALGDPALSSGVQAPAKIGTSTWLGISASDYSSAAIKTDGTLWVWGYNVYGKLGDGTITNSPSPEQIGTSTWMTPSFYTVSITKNGSGTGTVTSSPSGISCGSTCSNSFAFGKLVTLTATADSGYSYSNWTGCDSTSGSQCMVTMLSNKSVSVTFGTSSTNALTVSNPGNGTVTSSPAGINCGAVCSNSYVTGTSIVLTATPNDGYSFAMWTGCDNSTGNPANQCPVTLSTDRSVSVLFTPIIPTEASLSVTKTGGGSGIVISDPIGINCGPVCSKTYNVIGTTVKLTALPDTGYSVAGWTGCDNSTGNQCTVVMSSNKSVTASFIQSSEYIGAITAISNFASQYPLYFGAASGNVTIASTTGGAYYIQSFTNGTGLLAWTDGNLYYYSGTGWWVSLGVTWRVQTDFDMANAAIKTFYNQNTSFFGPPSDGILVSTVSTGTYYIIWFTNGSAIVAWTDGYMYYIYGGNVYSFDMPWKTVSNDDKAHLAINLAYSQNVPYYGTPSGGIVTASNVNGAYYIQWFTNGTGIMAWTDGYLYNYTGNGSWASLGTTWKTTTKYDKASVAINYYCNQYSTLLGIKYGNITGGTTQSGTSFMQWYINGSAITAWTDGNMYYYSGVGPMISLGRSWQ